MHLQMLQAQCYQEMEDISRRKRVASAISTISFLSTILLVFIRPRPLM